MENTARADADKPKADAELKDKVIVDKDEAKGDGDKPKEATIGDVLNAVKSLSDRVDAIEKGRGDNNEEKGEPEDLAADDADDDEEAKARRGALRKRTALERADASELSFKSEHLFYDWQARVDGVAGHYGAGHHAPKPMISETLRNYKVRCLRPWQYADVDLKVLSIADGQAFAVACDEILKAADSEAKRPSRIPNGWLSERRETTAAGHQVVRFYGRPKVWMDQFMPRAQRVKRVHRADDKGNLTGVAYQRD